MKIRNAVLALGLAIVMSFGFTTNLSATTADVPAIEYGVTGVIILPSMENGLLVISMATTSMVELALITPNGQRAWSTKTNNETTTVNVNRYAPGTYTLVATANGKSQFYTIQI